MSRLGVIALDQLGPMQVLETIDTEAVLDARMAKLVELWKAGDPPAGAAYDVGSLEFDPIKINQEVSTYFELMLRDRVNQAARAVTLAFAIGSDLDAIASRYPGGVPRLPGESDDRYRRRIWLSPNTLGPHGTAEAYQFWALTALDGVLRDVSTIKIRPRLEDDPIILITCLAEGDDPKPSTAQLLAVRSYIQSEARQGMTDVISVVAPKVLETRYRVRVWLYPGPDGPMLINLIRQKLAALVEAQRWLGFDHALMAIQAACAQPGVHHTEIVEPAADLFVEPDWIVKVIGIDVELMGRAE